MKKLVIVITILAVCSSFVYFAAAHPRVVSADGSAQEAFIKDYGTSMDLEQEYAVSMPNGNVIVFGMVKTHSTDGKDFFLMRITEKGKIVWAKRYAQKGDETIIDYTDAKPTSDGGIVLTAITGGKRYRLAVVKIKGNGDIEWQKVFPEYEATAWGIIQTSDKGFLIGMHINPPQGSGQAQYKHGFLLTKLDENGNVSWSKLYSETDAFDEGVFVAEDSKGNFLASGRRYPPKEYGTNPLLLKVDKNGNLIWEEEIKCGPKKDSGDEIIKSAEGDGFVIAGWTHSFGSGDRDEIIYRVTNNGELKWLKTYGWNKEEYGVNIFAADNGYTSFMKTASINENKTVNVFFKIDTSGNVAFSKALSAEKDFAGFGTGICQTSDKGFIFPVSSESFSDRNIWNDIVMVKTDSDGNIPGCKYIKDAYLKAIDHTKDIKVVKFTPNIQNVTLKEEDAGFKAVPMELTVKTVCQPKSGGVVLLIPKVKFSSSLSNGGATIIWEQVKQGTYPVAGYAIYRGTESGKEDFNNPIATVGANTTQYTDKTVELSKTYYYVVKTFDNQNPPNFSKPSNEVKVKLSDTVVSKHKIIITLQPDIPYMTVNGVMKEIDPGRGTKPVIVKAWGRTVVPIRAIVEALGGTIGWNGKERKVTIQFNGTTIELWIDNPKAKVNGETKWIDENNHDVKPIIVNSRTMLPLRFVTESLGCSVDWNAATKTITITYTP